MRKRQVLEFEGVRERRVETGHPNRGRFQVIKRLLADEGDQLGAQPARPRGFVHDDETHRLAHAR